MLHYETITSGTLELLRKLRALPLLKDTRLVGGTALALQLGHRKSVDIDLFGQIHVETFELNYELSRIAAVTSIKQSPNIHIYLIEGIKVDIVNYPYPWIEDVVREDDLRIAGIKDIAAMKIAAITGRGSKKDFVDIYFLLQQFSLAELIEFYLKKYSDGSEFMALKSLTYFEDAESDPSPEMLIDIEWDDVKRAITTACKKYLGNG